MPFYISSFSRMNESEINEQINSEENVYISQINECAERVINDGAKIIFLAGGSCSGKTTTALLISEFLSKKGKRVFAFSTDDFFFDEEKASVNDDGTKNYDEFSHTDSDYIVSVLQSIADNRKVLLPTFDFKLGRRTTKTVLLDPAEYDVIILEGIHALNDKIVYSIPDSYKSFKVYLSLINNTFVNENTVIYPNESRFFRRLIRDSKHRFADAERSFGLWKHVICEEEKTILPYIKNAQMTISSHFPYEVSVEKKQIVQVISGIKENSIYKTEKERLLEKMNLVPEIDMSFVPERSVLNEFIL